MNSHYKNCKISPEKSSRSGGLTRHNHFTFLDHRQDINTILKKYGWIDDHEDFWKFLKKYESIKKTGSIDPKNLICFKLDVSTKDVLKHVTSRKLGVEEIKKFFTIVLAYLNFKQLEKFNKLKKIRQSQTELPVSSYETKIIDVLKKENVLIIAGDTGCGKSTQVPQYLMKNGFGSIACTQPRRLACVSLCSRLKYETLTQFQNKIGYQVRFERNKNKETKIIFLTEGLLVRHMLMDPELTSYDVVILDEVHERHIQSDFVLGLLKCLLLKRKDLKVVLMSATINTSLFYDYFEGKAKIIEIPGRLFPVQVIYKPVFEDDAKKKSKVDATPYLQIMQIIDEKYQYEKGDVLIFMSGISEIMCLADAINEYKKKSPRWIVLLLHSSLPLSDQDKVFDYPPDGFRKCVISTNIAETSITIDGIRFVIDSGKVKEMFYDTVYKIQRLKEFWISRSSAEQRKGRAGRTGPGICYRIYSEEDYNAFEEYSLPEIKKSPLDAVLLQMIEMGLPDVRQFPFLEEPNKDDLENCIVSLKQQRALTDEEKITEIGRTLTNLPVELTIGKMLIIGSVFRQIDTTIILSSALSVPSPYTNEAFRNFDMENLRKEFESDHGDPITIINLYREWLLVKKEKEDSKRWCRKRGLEEQRFYEMTKLNHQFKEILTDSGLLQLNEPEPTTSHERMIRHGEVKLLKRLKADHSKNPVRKKLKPDTYEVENESEKLEIDVRDIEFRLKNDGSKVRELLKGIKVTSYRDLAILKIVFCSGLYPRFAIADEFNICRSDQLFHTKVKSHISLHPFSYFGLHPEILKLEDQEIIIPSTNVKYNAKTFSSKHKIICYFALLETTKVYLTNMIQMPAFQTLLLFSKSIDVSFNFSKFIFDNWILIEVLNPRQSEVLIIKLISLRKKWNSLISTRLSRDCVDEMEVLSVTDDLITFLNTDIVYGLKRLLPADLKYAYIGPSDFDMSENYFDESFQLKKNETKGGFMVTEFLTYNCVLPNEREDLYATDSFHCSNCDCKFNFNCLERIEHSKKCKKDKEDVVQQYIERKPNSNEYFCEICNNRYFFTSIEILKHKKRCK